MVEYIKKANIPARVSYTAGTFVCNDIMYRVLYMIDKEFPNMRGGFYTCSVSPGAGTGTPGWNTKHVSADDRKSVRVCTKSDCGKRRRYKKYRWRNPIKKIAQFSRVRGIPVRSASFLTL